jgi:hypothetical protein
MWQGGHGVDFVAVMDQVIALLRQRGRLTYRTLQRQFHLDDAALDDLKDELIYGQRLAVDEEGKVLVWSGETALAAAAPAGTPAPVPLAYTPPNSVRLNFCMVAELSDATVRDGRSTPSHWPTR